MSSGPPRQNRTGLIFLGLFVLGLLAFLIMLQSSNIWKSFAVETASDTLLLYGLSSLNVAAFVIFGFIFLRSLVKLIRERRTLQLGSKIKSRLFFYFALVSLLPILAMAVFSYLFLNRALDRWFTQIPEGVVREAKEIQERSNLVQFERFELTARMLASILGEGNVSKQGLNDLAASGGLAFAQILDASSSIIASSEVAADVRTSREFGLLESGSTSDPSLRDGIGVDIAIAPLPDGRRLAIGADLRGSDSVSKMFESALVEFDRLKREQVTVRQIGFLTLGVLTFLLIFASSWTAFYIARGLTVPIKALAEGAERIAQGELGHRVDVLAEDELALLVRTFNEMSGRLEANATEITERRRYIETVLLSLPTGVISLDGENRITTINPAAKSILRLEPGDFGGLELDKILEPEDRQAVESLIARARRIGHASDNSRLSSLDGPGSNGLPVAITATALPAGGGVVLVIEDLSELIAAQRASAWQEVARRMAHEIKNPLTPIQLSAERIARRFASQPAIAGNGGVMSDEGNARVVAEGTNTILREVQSLKSMVDEFSRFARLPSVRLELWDLNEVVRESAALYQGRDEISIELTLAEDLPAAMIDDEQLKRVFVNLIDNAMEAPGSESKIIEIASSFDAERDVIVIEISDNGEGIDPANQPKLFQPYFSTKGRGTGLGLAIVHRIISDHKGKIRAVPNQPRGARFIIELPVPTGI
jgi:two-component system, NtrC family, nitrogen regulation sensor histidine kinase NtrY